MPRKYVDPNQNYYHDYYQFQGRSQWMEKIWSEAFGDAYPQGLEHYGYLTNHDLEVFASRLQLAKGATLLDMGCGKGGPGLKIAERLKCKLIGMDVIPEAVALADAFQQQFALSYPAQFVPGEFYHIPLPDQSVDAIICFDSIWAAPNKIQALIEAKRVMKPGASFIFTHWDLLAQEAQTIPLLEQSGLSFVFREDTPNWIEYQNKVYEGILTHENELVAEMGAAAGMLLHEAKTSPPYLNLSVRRIYEFKR